MRSAALRWCVTPALPAAPPPSRGLCGRQLRGAGGGGAAAAAAARKITEKAKKSLAALKKENPRLEPTLAIIQAHNDHLIQDINKNFAKEVGLRVIHICLPEGSSKDEIVNEILRLNEDPNVHGLALDLQESLYSSKVLNAVKPEKDVDGLSSVNLGHLIHGDAYNCLVPPAACAVMELLEDLGGKTVLLVGASGAVGAALQCMLQREGAVTVSCQWKAPQLQNKLHHADVVVVCSTKPDDVPVSWIKPGTTIISCSLDLLSGRRCHMREERLEQILYTRILKSMMILWIQRIQREDVWVIE